MILSVPAVLLLTPTLWPDFDAAALDVAIASYYQGNASVRSRGMYDDTRRYVANVQTLTARYR